MSVRQKNRGPEQPWQNTRLFGPRTPAFNPLTYTVFKVPVQVSKVGNGASLSSFL